MEEGKQPFFFWLKRGSLDLKELELLGWLGHGPAFAEVPKGAFQGILDTWEKLKGMHFTRK